MSQPHVTVWVQRFTDRATLSLQWIDPLTGKRKTKSAKTSDPETAETARQDLEYELRKGTYAEPSKLQWATFRKAYETERLAAHSSSSRKKARVVFDSFERTVNPRQLADLTSRVLSLYVTKLRERGREPATIHGHLRYLKAAFRWGAKQGLLKELPAFEMPKVPKGSSRAKIQAAARITTEAFERLLMKSPNDGWRLYLSLAWHCGLRRAEARGVRGEDVDLDARKIAIPENKAGDKAATAFITPELAALLRSRWPDGLPAGELIRSDEMTSNLDHVTRTFKSIARHAAVRGGGKDGLCTFHDLRRNYGTRWAGKAPAQVLQRLMRHSAITTTLNFYADVEQAASDLVTRPT